MDFQEISHDAVNSRIRDKSAIYKNIPMTHNKNNVDAKSKELEKAINDDPDKDTGY